MNEDNSIGVFIIGLMFGFMIGIFVTGSLDNHINHKDAIQHGYAHYDTTNGLWHWNNETNK